MSDNKRRVTIAGGVTTAALFAPFVAAVSIRMDNMFFAAISIHL